MYRVLLIDDEPGIRDVVSCMLREEGHEVFACPDGASGIEALRSFRPDLVLTDLKMPGMDGIEVLRQVAQSDPTIPVVFLTAFDSLAETADGLSLGAFRCLGKPVDRARLLETVADAGRLHRDSIPAGNHAHRLGASQ